MPAFSQRNAATEVLTFKEGLLSPIAHDLRIRVQRFDVTVEDGEVEGDFDLGSLTVSCARKDGADEPGLLSDADKEKIRLTMLQDVLHTARYPDTHFHARLDTLRDGYIDGELELHGESHAVRAKLVDEPAGVRVSVEVHQPTFGIKPYQAMFGTLRVRADVVIDVLLQGTTIQELLDA